MVRPFTSRPEYLYNFIWQCVKTLYPCSSHQNSWDLWMFIPLKMLLIGIDPYPYKDMIQAQVPERIQDTPIYTPNIQWFLFSL